MYVFVCMWCVVYVRVFVPLGPALHVLCGSWTSPQRIPAMCTASLAPAASSRCGTAPRYNNGGFQDEL